MVAGSLLENPPFHSEPLSTVVALSICTNSTTVRPIQFSSARGGNPFLNN